MKYYFLFFLSFIIAFLSYASNNNIQTVFDIPWEYKIKGIPNDEIFQSVLKEDEESCFKVYFGPFLRFEKLCSIKVRIYENDTDDGQYFSTNQVYEDIKNHLVLLGRLSTSDMINITLTWYNKSWLLPKNFYIDKKLIKLNYKRWYVQKEDGTCILNYINPILTK